MKRYPRTAIQLGNVLVKRNCASGQRWCMGKPHGVWCAWIDGFDPADAHVSYEDRKLWVNLDRGEYFFELDRLHEDYPAWSWRKQIEGKTWARLAHFTLLDALVELFPAKGYAPQCEGELS